MLIKTVEDLHSRFRAYLEATYHISATGLLRQRQALLDQQGVIRQPAFLESTKAYVTGPGYDQLLRRAPAQLRELAQVLSAEGPQRLLYDPPYKHQGDALTSLLERREDIVVYTGTGSGKTECFTIPALFRLLNEAATDPESFRERAMRVIILYPMNALVNDQLGRIRRLFGDDRVLKVFQNLPAARPATFGQYTGRTPFPGVRDYRATGDGRRMQAFKEFYIDRVLQWLQSSVEPTKRDQAERLKSALDERGRWPKKHNLGTWFGTGEWSGRLHPDPLDSELLARHEVYGYRHPKTHVATGGPSDVLITNYSMLEYMLLRPIERPIFDRTAAWLAGGKDRSLLLVLDEAHLYRGAQGTEVALLVRRIRERLGLGEASAAKKLQIAITSASFSSATSAQRFAAQLVARPASGFRPLGGDLKVLDPVAGDISVDPSLLAALAEFPTTALLQGPASARRDALDRLPRLLVLLGSQESSRHFAAIDAELQRALYIGLERHPLRLRLVSLTQSRAQTAAELAERIFPRAAPDLGGAATQTLIALCALAKDKPEGASLLPSRVHSFHRGLPGLWVCVDASCPAGDAASGTGKLFWQPRDTCDECGARVFELYTCRACGAAYALSAVSSAFLSADPTFLWPGEAPGRGTALVRLQILLAPIEPANLSEQVKVLDLDPRTGRIISKAVPGSRRIAIFLPGTKPQQEETKREGRLFFTCGVCGDSPTKTSQGKIVPRSPVEDHQTAGQDPFYVLVRQQLIGQPPRPRAPAHLRRRMPGGEVVTTETALRGRKVLVFSDGRQKAARLASELGRASLRDCLRPLVLRGARELKAAGVQPHIALSYLALLIGAVKEDVQLAATDDRTAQEVLQSLRQVRLHLEIEEIESLVQQNALPRAPKLVATTLLRVLFDRHTGFSALALASFEPDRVWLRLLERAALPSLPGFRAEEMSRLLICWIGLFLERNRCDLFEAIDLEENSQWLSGEPHSGAFDSIKRALRRLGSSTEAAFITDWLPRVRATLQGGAQMTSDDVLMKSSRLLIVPAEETPTSWVRCGRCSRVQPAALPGNICIRCSVGQTVPLVDPESWRLFSARKGFYRQPIFDRDPTSAIPLVAREHTAQLTGVAGEAQNRAERHELAFQDITEDDVDGMRSPIDVLSCTTTMEVGIDIGELSGVALRNMPPGRANYQQRAGRAGRRGNVVATVIAYADQDGHNQASFDQPARLIKDDVPDPLLDLSNAHIAKRHRNAFILQQFLLDSIPGDREPTKEDANLFASLGTIENFLSNTSTINLARLVDWLSRAENVETVQQGLERWLPAEVRDRRMLIEGVTDLIGEIRAALKPELEAMSRRGADVGEYKDAAHTDLLDEEPEDISADDSEVDRVPAEAGSLLARLLYAGVLPKYAFPTDLVSFRVYEATNGLGDSKTARDRLRYAPQRSLPMALSEYAPGRTVFIDGRLWQSGAVLGVTEEDLAVAFRQLKHIRLCNACGHAQLFESAEGGSGEACPACQDQAYGAEEALPWLRPPGFGHRVTFKARTEPEPDQLSRAGQAVLHTTSPAEWSRFSAGLCSALLEDRDDQPNELIVTNEGPDDEGFRVCKGCGAAEPTTAGPLSDDHRRPRPNRRGFSEPCTAPELTTVRLGTKFRTDALLLRFSLPDPQRLLPGSNAYRVAARSLAEALGLACAAVLEVEASEVVAGFRPGMPAQEPIGSSIELFLYDQLSGGAGYVLEASRRLPEVFEATKALLEHKPYAERTPPPPCDRACYGCLLSFKNSHEHALFDRQLAIDLLSAALTGRPAKVSEASSADAYAKIARWLELLRPHGAPWTVAKNAQLPSGDTAPLAVVRSDGRVLIPAICHPFSAKIPDSDNLREQLAWGAGGNVDVFPIDYLGVRRMLPNEMDKLMAAVG